MKPVGQLHVPEEVQTPEPAHGGEQAEDWMSSKERDVDVPAGSCDTSGTESQRTTRLVDDDPVELTAAQTLLERAKELAVSGVDVLAAGDAASGEKPAWPA